VVKRQREYAREPKRMCERDKENVRESRHNRREKFHFFPDFNLSAFIFVSIRFILCTLQHTATRCNTLQHTHQGTLEQQQVVDCNKLQHTTTHCNTLQHIYQDALKQQQVGCCNTMQHIATFCNTLQRTETHIPGALKAAASCRLQHTLQRAATHCNTHTEVPWSSSKSSADQK